MAKDAKYNKDVKNKKHFFKDFKAELKKVIWPTPKQIVNSTIAVVTIVLIAAIIVFALDSIFNLFNENVVNKFKADIKNKVVIEENIGTESLVESVEATETTEQENNENTVENQSSVENVQ